MISFENELIKIEKEKQWTPTFIKWQPTFHPSKEITFGQHREILRPMFRLIIGGKR